MTAILGVDPGLTGALALYDLEAGLTIFDVPVVRVNQKHQIDLYQLGNWLDLHRNAIAYAMIEDVHSMPKQGVASSFKFGFTAGALQSAIAANQIPMKLVQPTVWKRQFGLLGKGKDASRLAASRIAPKFAGYWPLKKHDGRAEAFLLAVYGSLTEFPKNFGGTE